MATYPKYLNQVRDLVEQHRELVEEPLLLAIYYAPNRDPEDVFLFEILDNFRGSALDASGDILEVMYGQTELFVLEQRNAILLRFFKEKRTDSVLTERHHVFG